MDFTTNLVRRFPGTPFQCRISKVMRTMIYEVPYYRISDGNFSPCVVKETDDFKAAVVTNPVNQVLTEAFSVWWVPLFGPRNGKNKVHPDGCGRL